MDVVINVDDAPLLPEVAGEPMFADIQLTTHLLNENAFSVTLLLSGGNHGHLIIIMISLDYVLMCETPVDVPVDPGPLLVIVPDITTRSVAFTHNTTMWMPLSSAK
jgi:hypothetical protein